MFKKNIFILISLLITQFVIDVQGHNEFPTEEYKSRREKLFDKIGDNVGIIWGAQPSTAPVKFRQSPDFYYLTGIEDPDAILVLNGKNKKTYIFLDKPDDNRTRWTGSGIWQEEDLQNKYGIDFLFPYDNFWNLLFYLSHNVSKCFVPLTPADYVDMGRYEANYRELNYENHPINNYLPFWKQAIKKIRETLPGIELANINPMIDELRWIKTDYEIQQLKIAGEIGAEGVLEAMKNTKSDIFEYELEAVASYTYIRKGARGDAFSPIVASGPNTYIVHYQQNDRKLEKGDFVLMDYGCDYHYYTSDITRVWPVTGKFTRKEEKMYQCILEARDSIIASMAPGVTLKELKDILFDIYKKHGFEDKALSWNGYIGHFVGISVHDVTPDDYERPLEAGVVFNVEPVLDDPEKKRHMRLEDTILITDDGAINLTAGAPVQLEEIYNLIEGKSSELK